MTTAIRHAIDEAKMNGSFACELDDADFDFANAGGKEHYCIVEDVWVFRKGKREEVEAKLSMTTEDLEAMEAEQSRLKRVAEESKPGRLRRPDIQERDYHPKRKPESAE